MYLLIISFSVNLKQKNLQLNPRKVYLYSKSLSQTGLQEKLPTLNALSFLNASTKDCLRTVKELIHLK